MVLAEVSMDFLMAIFGLTAGLTYIYDWRYWGFSHFPYPPPCPTDEGGA